MRIQKDLFYKPRDIAKHKLILSSRGMCSYNFVLDEIIAGRLQAEDFRKPGVKLRITGSKAVNS